MILSTLGLLDTKNAVSANSLQSMEPSAAPDPFARKEQEMQATEFLRMLLRAAGCDDNRNAMAENSRQTGALSKEMASGADPEDRVRSMTELTGTTDFSAWMGNNAFSDRTVADNPVDPAEVTMPMEVSAADLSEELTDELLFSTLAGAGQFQAYGEKYANQGSRSEAGDILEILLNSGDLQEMKNLLDKAGRLESKDRLQAVLQSLMNALQGGREDFQGAHNPGQPGGNGANARAMGDPDSPLQALLQTRAGRADTSEIFQALQAFLETRSGQAGRLESNDRLQAVVQPLMDALQGGREDFQGTRNPGQTGGNGANAGAMVNSEAAQQTVWENHAGQGHGPQKGQGVQPPMQAMDDSPAAQVLEEAPDRRQTDLPLREAGPQNLQAKVEPHTSSSAAKTEHSQAVFRESGSGSPAPADPLAGGAGLFEKAENAASTVQQGGASFDTQLKAAESQVVSQVSVRLFTGMRQGSGNMTIHMNPPELGSVKVKIISDQGSLSVHLHPQNHQVAAILERHLPGLHQSLVDQGIDLAGLQVSVDAESDGGASQFEENGADLFAGRKNPGNNPADDENLTPGAQDPPNSGPYQQSRGLSLRV